MVVVRCDKEVTIKSITVTLNQKEVEALIETGNRVRGPFHHQGLGILNQQNDHPDLLPNLRDTLRDIGLYLDEVKHS